MRTSILTGLGLALFLAVAIAAPAHAETTTTFDVPVDAIVPVPAELLGTATSAWGVADPQNTPTWAAVGPLSLPLAMNFPAAGNYANSIAIPAPPAGCTRTVNGYRYTFAGPLQVSSLGGLLGKDLTHRSASFSIGSPSVAGQTTWIASLNEARPSTDIAFVYQVFYSPTPESPTLLDYSVNITDTCPSAPAAAADDVPASLPDTGIETLPLGLGALALLLSGVALLSTRRISLRR